MAIFQAGSARFTWVLSFFSAVGLAVLAMILGRDLVGTGIIIGTLLGATGYVKSQDKKQEVEELRCNQK
jgi:hypothetical protein